MTQGKIERFHRSMKNVVKLQHYYLPWELEQEIGRFIEYYPGGIPSGQPRAVPRIFEEPETGGCL